MRFVPYNEGTIPNIVVDGSPNQHTIVTLSHWPKSGTPKELKADTSAEIAFNYLDSPELQVTSEVVTNNHFDEDGLIGVFALTNPGAANRYRDLLVDVASAGDFGVFKDRDAVRICFAVSSLSNPKLSPLAKRIFELPYPKMAAELYMGGLDLLPRLLTQPNDYRSLWEDEEARLLESERLLREGVVAIEEQRDMDFAVVRTPPDVKTCHPLAIYNSTPCTRLLLLQGQHAEVQYRYEGWVQFVSRNVVPRVDLSDLADELNREERTGGRWMFDDVASITPRLFLEGKRETSIPCDVIRQRVERHLRTAPPAWHPHDA